MIQDEFYYTDESDSDDSNSSITRRQSISYDPKNFASIYEHKQVQTLRFLRQTLKENKILKRRLNIVESELERFEDFKTILPAVEIKNQRSDSTSGTESPINEALLTTTEDKECQVELIIAPVLYENDRVNRNNSTNAVNPSLVFSRPTSSTFELAKSEDYVRSQETFTNVTDLNQATDKLVASTIEEDSKLVTCETLELIKFDKACQCEIKEVKVAQEVVVESKQIDAKDLTEVLNAVKLERDALQGEKDSLNDEIGG